MKKYLKAYVDKSSATDEEGVLQVCVATDNQEDRDGEIVDPSGLDLKDFMKNPVLLWAHDYRSEPIGKVIEIKKEGTKVLFKPKFAIDISEKARQVYRLIKEGYINAFSIGFLASEREGNTFTKSQLLEISVVPVPSNARALVQVRGMKSLDKELIKEIEDYKEKAVVAYKDEGTVQNFDAEWDGSAEVKKVGDDLEMLKRMSTWYEKGSEETKNSYKLPHHQAGDLKAVWRGVAAAMAALLGARGGVDIPEGDRKAVYDHLAKHYKQFDKKAPEFKLVEAQVLKDVDLDVESPSVVKIVQVSKDEIKSLAKDIDNINPNPGANGEGDGGKAPSQRSVVNADIFDIEKTKRLLQVAAKSTGEAIHAINQLRQLKKKK